LFADRRFREAASNGIEPLPRYCDDGSRKKGIALIPLYTTSLPSMFVDKIDLNQKNNFPLFISRY
jgi:hypothetical protein